MEGETWIEENWWLLVIIGFVILVIIVIVILGVFLSRRKKVKIPVESGNYESQWVEALGGEENIVGVTIKGNKLEVELNNFTNFDTAILARLGVSHRVLKGHFLTFSVDKDVKEIEKLLSPHIKGIRNY